MNRTLNWKPSPPDLRDIKSLRAVKASPLPDEFELPLKTTLYDQLNIGSCVMNSGCTCFNYEVLENFKDVKFEPSRLFGYYNARKLQGWENEDSGSYIRDGFKAMNKWGLCKESLWPYIESKVTTEPTKLAYDDGPNQITIKYATVPQTETAIKQVLVSGAAVSFGFWVYDSFMDNWDSTTGVMPIPKPGESFLGGHAVTIIGWSNAKKCFLIQNSWGTSWGQEGLFWMPYSFLLNPKYASDFWCIEEIKMNAPLPPTPEPEPIPDPPTPTYLVDAKKVFTRGDLQSMRESLVLKIGQALGLAVNQKLSKRVNINIICEHLMI